MREFTKLIILCCFMAINTTISAQIISCSNLSLFESAVHKADVNTLVIFDVDHVLIMPTDEYSLNRNPYRRELWHELRNKYSKEDFNFLRSIAVSSAKWCLVDSYITNIFSYLQKKGIKTVALTSLNTGKFGVIKKMEDLRVKELNSVGINISRMNTLTGTLSINNLSGVNGVPMLKSGIIFTAEIDKAIVLESILVSKNYQPKRIMFIDDQINNLESVGNLCKKRGIEFQGFHYIAVSKMKTHVIDKKLEKFRFQILEKQNIWLSYRDLATKLNISFPLVENPV